MRLKAARVQNYRSIKDTGWFDVEQLKTILVGPNEAGKTTILRALEAVNPPDGKSTFEWLRDYPRSLLSDLGDGDETAGTVLVSSARFALESDDVDFAREIDESFNPPDYFEVRRYLNNEQKYVILDGYELPKVRECRDDLSRFGKHIALVKSDEADEDLSGILSGVDSILAMKDNEILPAENCNTLLEHLDAATAYVDEDNEKETTRLKRLRALASRKKIGAEIGSGLLKRVPKFVYFSSYFSVKPSIHLEHLAIRVEQSILDDEAYDFGNLCLLKLLGFTPRELAELGKVSEPIPPEQKTESVPGNPPQKRKMALPVANPTCL